MCGGVGVLTRPSFPPRSPPFSHIPENHSVPPDVTGYTNNTANTTATDGIQVERGPGAGTAAQRQIPKYGNAELMETGDGESGFRGQKCFYQESVFIHYHLTWLFFVSWNLKVFKN